MRWVMLGLVACLSLIGYFARPAPDWRFAATPRATLGTGPSFETLFEYEKQSGQAHAPAVVPEGDTKALLWFDGIRESHNDVKILKALLPGEEVTELFSRQSVSGQFTPRQTILTLGNTIGDVTENSHFATVVTLGGWAASSIAHIADGTARKLNLSPVIARSHLVRSPVVAMANGQVMLPAYFEVSEGYGVAVLLDANRRVRGQAAMRSGFSGIQPVIVPYTASHAVALLRRFDKSNDKLLASWTTNGGQSWSPPAQLSIPNPNAPVAAVALEDDRLLMLYNDDAARADRLRFATSTDFGKTWQPGRYLVDGTRGNVRYPMMHVLPDGQILATYSTGDKTGIAAQVFSADWAVAQ